MTEGGPHKNFQSSLEQRLRKDISFPFTTQQIKFEVVVRIKEQKYTARLKIRFG